MTKDVRMPFPDEVPDRTSGLPRLSVSPSVPPDVMQEAGAGVRGPNRYVEGPE